MTRSAPRFRDRQPLRSADATCTIGDAALALGVEPHVLRFWESKFSQITPVKRAGGRRYYRQQDIDLLHRIRSLLYEEGYTIKGVQRLLDEETASGRLVTTLPRPVAMMPAGDPAAEVPADAERRDDIVATLEDLREALAQLREALQVS
jgi:DNA-binding transcriptional MerR regulator